jgi:MarR family transcriptional regulator for hemolysin
MRLVERVATLQKAVTRLLRKQLATRTDRPFLQLKALRVIANSTQACTQSALAEKLMIDPAAASRLVDRLVAEGLVKRCESPDRRCVRLAVTRASARELAIIENAIELVERELVNRVGARAARDLAGSLGELTDALIAEPAAVAPTARRPAARRA